MRPQPGLILAAAACSALAAGCAHPAKRPSPPPRAPAEPAPLPPAAPGEPAPFPSRPTEPAPTLPATAASLARELNLDPDAILDGEISTRTMKPGGPTELALAAAFIVRAPAQDIARSLADGGALRADPGLLALGDNPAEATFEPGDLTDARRFLQAEPGARFNLSSAELDRLGRAAPGPDSADVLEAAARELRAILQARAEAYRAGGDIPPLDRGGGRTTDPAAALATPSPARTLIVGSRPADPRRGHLWWTKSTVEGRPQFELIHTDVDIQGGRPVYFERHFFALHTYSAIDVAIAVVQMGDQSVVFYTNRTWTDELTGFGGALRRGIAADRFKREVAAYLGRLRDALEHP